MEEKFIVKIHETYRGVVAICDLNLKGKIIEEGDKQLDVSTNFFEGNSVKEEELREIMIKANNDDATFYIVGNDSVNVAKSVGIVGDEGVLKVGNVSFALVLL